jgi:carbon-monoxide dehydrogenase large subunit
MIHSKDGSEMKPGIHPPLALGKVRHVGDPVAVVIADSRQMARDAAEMIDVEYEDLAAVVSLKNAAGHESSVHNEVPGNVAFDWELGNKDETRAALDCASHKIELDLYNNRLAPNAMETRALNAFYDKRDDRYTLYIASQNPHGNSSCAKPCLRVASQAGFPEWLPRVASHLWVAFQS